MFLLAVYILVALGFSFFCSIAEAVLLSITPSFISLQDQMGRKKLASALYKLKDDINTPLAAILTLNTIAHTVGAAGAGAQAASIFGDQFVGIISAVLTLLILVFSEIIPKTLGAHYWKQLAPVTVYLLKYLIVALYPFVKLSAFLTRWLSSSAPTLKGFNREEFAAMVEISTKEGQLLDQEQRIIKNLLRFHEIPVRKICTPRTVVFVADQQLTISEYFNKFESEQFSRIPVYEEHREQIVGFVLRSDLLLARARGELDHRISTYKRPINAFPEYLSLSKTFERFLSHRDQIVVIIDEHGGFEGIVTLEDLFEKLLGYDIVDESDKAPNMRKLAKSVWQVRRKEMEGQRELPPS